MKTYNSVLSDYGTTIFTVMSALAKDHGAINLGQGFPDEEPPEDLRLVAAEALRCGSNQYPPMLGLPALRAAVADHDRRFYHYEADPATQVMVTSGATEALADAFLALIEPGDEVVLFEPLYDSYLPMVQRAGGIPRLVSLHPPDWLLPEDDLAAAFGPATKLVVLNSPHNPTGKVFSVAELDLIADLTMGADAYAVCDEVYEHLVFSGACHTPLITRPGMAERCVRIGSVGKTFSATGWKIGYVVAPPPLMAAVAKAHQFVTFTTPPNLQTAAAFGLGRETAFFQSLAADLGGRRDRLAEGLNSAGFDVRVGQGTYFLTADVGSVGWNGSDVEFCRTITSEAGVAAVPISAFYSAASTEVPEHLVRFCFCKRPETLDEAAHRLKRYFR